MMEDDDFYEDEDALRALEEVERESMMKSIPPNLQELRRNDDEQREQAEKKRGREEEVGVILVDDSSNDSIVFRGMETTNNNDNNNNNSNNNNAVRSNSIILQRWKRPVRTSLSQSSAVNLSQEVKTSQENTNTSTPAPAPAVAVSESLPPPSSSSFAAPQKVQTNVPTMMSDDFYDIDEDEMNALIESEERELLGNKKDNLPAAAAAAPKNTTTNKFASFAYGAPHNENNNNNNNNVASTPAAKKKTENGSNPSPEENRIKTLFERAQAAIDSSGGEEGKRKKKRNVDPSTGLNETQTRAYDAAMAGKSIFITGSGGTGKSFLVEKIVKSLRKKKKSVSVTAMTGVAAENIGGQTLNAFAGCGIPRRKEDFKRMWKAETVKRLRTVDVLVIDEISMLSGEMFDCLNEAIKEIRTNEAAFGGIQLILVGDFFQLPPIAEEGNAAAAIDGFGNRGFAFQSNVWRAANVRLFELDEVWRQEDEHFVGVLNRVRRGEVDESIATAFQKCQRPLGEMNGIKPTMLYCKNLDVNRINNEELMKLRTPLVRCASVDAVSVDPSVPPRHRSIVEEGLTKNQFFERCRALREVQLKEGAQVMLIWNLDLSSKTGGYLVNGSRGYIKGWVSAEEKYNQMQKDIDSKRGMGIEILMAQMADLKAYGLNNQLPIVAFVNGREETIMPVRWVFEISNYGSCMRIQIPLVLAWAITIHKSQGCTLDSVCVDLTGSFAEGQTYVALSRARSMEGLQVIGFSLRAVKVNPLASTFYRCVQQGTPIADSIPLWSEEVNCTPPPPVTTAGPITFASLQQGRIPSFTAASRVAPGGGGGFSSFGNNNKPNNFNNNNNNNSNNSTSSGSNSNNNNSSSYGSRSWGGASGGSGSGGAGRGTWGRGGGAAGGGGGAAGGGRGRGACFKCNKEGHWASNCPGK